MTTNKVVKLTRGQLRRLVQEAGAKRRSGRNQRAIEAFLAKQDLIGEDGENGSRASEALEQVRRVFYGSPWEAKLTAAILICDSLAAAAPEDEFGMPGDEDEIE